MSAAGRWNVTLNTPVGTLRCSWDLAETGGAWQGTMTGQAPVGNSELRSIRTEGTVVSFQTTAPSPMGALELTFEGQIAGDSLSGTCQSKYGSFPFSAVRG